MIIAGWEAIAAVGNFTIGGFLFMKPKQKRQFEERNSEEISSEKRKQSPTTVKANSSKKILLGSCLVNIFSLILLGLSDGVSWELRITKENSSTAASRKEPEKILLYAYGASLAIPIVLILICLITLCLIKSYRKKRSSTYDICMEELDPAVIIPNRSTERETNKKMLFVTTPFVYNKPNPSRLFLQSTKSYSDSELDVSYTRDYQSPIYKITSKCDQEVFHCPQMHDKDSLINLTPLELMARHQRMVDTYREIDRRSRKNLVQDFQECRENVFQAKPTR